MEMQDPVHPKHSKIVISLVILACVLLFLSFLDEYTTSLLLSYVLLYRYAFIFAAVFLAGLIVPIPVNILLLAVGSFSVAGQFNFWLSAFTAACANALGDSVAYFSFRNLGHKIVKDKYASKHGVFMRLENFFEKHERLSIFGSRIVGVFGTPVNFLSGYAKVPFNRFLAFDLLGNSAFVLIYLSIGYAMGDKWINISNLISDLMGLISVGLVIYIIRTAFEKSEEEVSI